MVAQPSPRREPHGYQNSKAEEYSRYRRRDHANIEAMQNLMIAAICEETGCEMKPATRALISALQGAHGGGEVVNEEFTRDYLSIGAQLQFAGSPDAIRSRVRYWLDDLEEWQIATGYLFFTIRKGGAVVGHTPAGDPIRQATVFIDHVKPVADDAVQRARQSELWRGDETKKVKPHPGRALAAQVAWAVAQVPRHPDAGRSAEAPTRKSATMTADDMKTSDVLKGRWTKAENQIAKILEAELETGADPVLVAAEHARRVIAHAHALHQQKADELEAKRRELAGLPPRGERIVSPDLAPPISEVLAALGLEVPTAAKASPATDNVASATTNTGEKTDLLEGFEEVMIGEPLGKKILTQSAPFLPGNSPDADAKNDPDLASAALAWARAGVPVFPLHSVFDGICSCREGSECKSAGKHPRTKNGWMDATTDEGRIAEWWRRWPLATIGGATGARSRLHVVDVDPKNDGDASLHDLCEVHGSDWLETLRVRTGSGGFHLFFRQPDDLDLRNTAGKIGPGIDSRGTGGYVVLAPSLHASGVRYEVVEGREVADLPSWLLERITATTETPAPTAIEFQAKRPRPSASGPRFAEGERNEGLFAAAIGRWRHGWMADRAELHAQLAELNEARCVPPLAASEVAKMAAHIARDYAHLRGIDADRRATA